MKRRNSKKVWRRNLNSNGRRILERSELCNLKITKCWKKLQTLVHRRNSGRTQQMWKWKNQAIEKLKDTGKIYLRKRSLPGVEKDVENASKIKKTKKWRCANKHKQSRKRINYFKEISNWEYRLRRNRREDPWNNL